MDYYRVLGISRDASKEEVKAAFRRLALRFHPDRQPSDASQSQRDAAASRFRQASEAYNVLGDAAKRLIYNREGRAGLHSEDYSRNSRQQHQRPYYRSGATPPRSTAWNFRVSLSPLDIAFHAVLAGILIIGLTYGDTIGKAIWDKKNAGKSFEDLIQAEHQNRALQQEQEEE